MKKNVIIFFSIINFFLFVALLIPVPAFTQPTAPPPVTQTSCVVTASAAGAGQVTGSAKELAQKIINNPKITKTARYVMEDLQNTAAGKPAYKDVQLNADMLAILVALGEKSSFSITAITGEGRGHSDTSKHYTGNAVDFGTYNGQELTGNNAPSIQLIKDIDSVAKPGLSFGFGKCNKASVDIQHKATFFEDNCNHVHFDIR